MRSAATALPVRNEGGRLGVVAIKVGICPAADPGDSSRVARCLKLFEGLLCGDQ